MLFSVSWHVCWVCRELHVVRITTWTLWAAVSVWADLLPERWCTPAACLTICTHTRQVSRHCAVTANLLHWSSAGGSVAEWLACWTQAQKGLGSNCSRDAVTVTVTVTAVTGNSLKANCSHPSCLCSPSSEFGSSPLKVCKVNSGGK